MQREQSLALLHHSDLPNTQHRGRVQPHPNARSATEIERIRDDLAHECRATAAVPA
jgi:hypothetical protein